MLKNSMKINKFSFACMSLVACSDGKPWTPCQGKAFYEEYYVKPHTDNR